MIAIELSELKPQRDTGIGRACIPGTCGELMQGTLDGVDFLVNSPIPFFADVRVSLTHAPHVRVSSAGNFLKVERAVRAVLDRAGYSRWGADVDILKSIPRGKGLASSTAEITAAITATSLALDEEPWVDSYADIVLGVDRSTDAVYAPGIVHCNFLKGAIVESFNAPASLSFIVVDSGGEVETVSFDRQRARQVSQQQSARLRQAYTMLRRGLRQGNAALVAQAATESALINQGVLPKELLGTLLLGTKDYGALGINCAHTGTILGVMFNPRRTSEAALLRRVTSLVGQEKIMGVYKLISGGRY